MKIYIACLGIMLATLPKALEGLAVFPPTRLIMWFGWTGLLESSTNYDLSAS